MPPKTTSGSSRSKREGFPPASTNAPRAASPHAGSGRSTTPPGPGVPARVAPSHRSAAASPLTTTFPASTRCPRLRHHGARSTVRAGSRPITSRRLPAGSPASARSSRSPAPRSKPSVSRSIVGVANASFIVVEPGLRHRRVEQFIAGRSSLFPRLQAFEVEQRPDLGVAERHAEQQLVEPCDRVARAVGAHGHVAVVEPIRLPDDGGGAGRKRSLRAEDQVVAVDHARGVDLAGDEGSGGVAFAADVIPVEPDAYVEAPHVDVTAGFEPCRSQVRERDQGGLRRVDRAGRDDFAREVADAGDPRVGPGDDDRREIAVAVAHRQRLHWDPGSGAEALCAYPRQGRVPRRVDEAQQQLVDLALVVRVQDVVEVEPAAAEPLTAAVPDRDDLGVVRHRAHDERVAAHAGASSSNGRPHRARPMKSFRASVVGAMTRAARASRNRRSTPSSLRNAAPPQICIARSVTSIAASPAAALTSSTRSCASSRPAPIAASASANKAAAWSVSIRIWARRARPTGCCASVWPRWTSWVRVRCAVASAVTACIKPVLAAAFSTRNHGSTTVNAMSSPAPSPPSIAAAGTSTPSAVTGLDAFPRSPRPSNGAGTLRPGASDGTSQSVIGPVAAIGRLDQT